MRPKPFTAQVTISSRLFVYLQDEDSSNCFLPPPGLLCQSSSSSTAPAQLSNRGESTESSSTGLVPVVAAREYTPARLSARVLFAMRFQADNLLSRGSESALETSARVEFLFV